MPLLVLGGGGYTIKNVARCWAYETAICLDTEIPNQLPQNDYYEYYGPDFNLHFDPKPDEKNQNSKEYLDFVQTKCLINLKALEMAPNVGTRDVSVLLDDFLVCCKRFSQRRYHQCKNVPKSCPSK